MKSVLRLVPAIAACILLAACAAPSTRPEPPATRDATLKQRAQQRWDFLIKHEAAKAWDYLTPGFRKTITREAYATAMNGRPVKWKKASVNKVVCQTSDSCVVYVSVTYTLQIPRIGRGTSFAPLTERWLRLDGRWYYLPREDDGNSIKATR